jgi:hypothetical protein
MELKEFVKNKIWLNTRLPGEAAHTFFIFSELP